MTITLNPEVEAKLLEKAQREGQNPDALANDVLLGFLAADSEQAASHSTAPVLPPYQPGEDPRLAVLREIDARSQFMQTKPSARDYLREGREGEMYGG
jgi:hypothetical protein